MIEEPLPQRRLRLPVALGTEESEVRRLWRTLFVSRHLVIVALAVATAVLEQFGDDRLLISALLLFGVLPYDLATHVFARRKRRLPTTMPYVYAPIPAVFAGMFPEVWVPALLAAAGNANLFALTFPLRTALASAALAAVGLGVVAALADVEPAVLGAAGFVVVTPAIVVGTNALLEALQISEERYRDYVENANDIIYTHDLERLAFIQANDAALRATGYSREELGDVRVTDVVAPEHLREADERIQRAIRSTEEPTPWELEIVAKDGRRIPVEVNTRIIRRRGEPVAVQGIARDISERRHLEAQRAALDQVQAEFIANAAHELRTPLTTLAGLASVLLTNREQLDDEELEEALEALTRQGRRAQILADKLLDLTSIELGRLDLDVETMPLRTVVEEVIGAAGVSGATDVRVEVDPELLVRSDRLCLGQILTNLLVNADRYGGPNVVVRGREVEGATVLEVVDDGPGVPAELAPHLFEPFSRGDGSRPDSTGLGLAICASLATALGCSIDYVPGEHTGERTGEPTGACFRLELPAPGGTDRAAVDAARDPASGSRS